MEMTAGENPFVEENSKSPFGSIRSPCEISKNGAHFSIDDDVRSHDKQKN